MASSNVSDTLKDFSTQSKEVLGSRLKGLKSVISEVAKSSLIHFTTLSAIVIIAIIVRLMPLRWGVYLGEFDPYIQYRNTEYMVRNGFASWFTWHDNMVWYPWGRSYAESTYPGLAITGAVLYMFVRSIGIDVTLYQFCVFFPVVFGAAAVVAAYLLGKEVWGKSVGLFSALFMALSASEISRTSLGWYDDETIGIFSMILFFAFFLKAISPNRSLRSSAIYATLSALTLAYFASGWGGFRYPMSLMAIFTLVLVLVGRYSRRLLMTYSITYGISLFVATQVPKLGYGYLTEMTGPMAVLGVFIILCAAELYRSVKGFQTKVLVTAGILGLLVVGAAAFWYLGDLTPLSGKWLAILNPGERFTLPIVESVAEHRPATWASFFYEFGIMMFLGLFGLIFATQRRRNSDIFLIVFALSAVYFAGSLVRLTLVMAPAFCILSGIAIVELGKPSVDILKETTIFPKRRIRITTHVGKEFGVAILLILLLVTMPTFYYAVASAYTPATIVTSSIPITPKEGEEGKYNDWLEALSWMKANLPENAVVFAWWDYGYWITEIAERRSMADNGTINSTQVAVIGSTFLSNETNALPVLKKYGVTHIAVFVTWTTSSSTSSTPGAISWVGFGEDNKWYWMAKIGNGTTLEGQKITFRELSSGQSAVYNRIITIKDKIVSNETIADSNGIKPNTILGKMIAMGVNPGGGETSDYFNPVFSSTNRFVLVYEVKYQTASRLTLGLDQSKMNYGENVTLSGRLTDDKGQALGDKIVFVEYSLDTGKTWGKQVGVLTLPNGTYRYSWKPDGGSYVIRTTWDGEKGKYIGTTSGTQELTVVRKASSVTAKLSSTNVKVGQSVKITATLSTKSNYGTVTVQYSLDNQTWNTITSGSSPASGLSSTDWTPKDPGRYYIRVSWSGDAEYDQASSDIVTLTVTT